MPTEAIFGTDIWCSFRTARCPTEPSPDRSSIRRVRICPRADVRHPGPHALPNTTARSAKSLENAIELLRKNWMAMAQDADGKWEVSFAGTELVNRRTGDISPIAHSTTGRLRAERFNRREAQWTGQ